MDRTEALRLADEYLERLIASGDAAIFEAARGPDGTVDTSKIAAGAMRARERLADEFIAESEAAQRVATILSGD